MDLGVMSNVNPPMTAQANIPPTSDGPEPLTSSMLAAASPQEQKQMLGERLFPLIQVKKNPLILSILFIGNCGQFR